ncbi:MAG: YggT family protein [Roseiflexaceae bacterium]|nr:YggT family protein [Roseiflexaceae bacterium]
MQRFLYSIIILLGALEALLLARIVLQLFAARPDNFAFATLLAVTAPLRTPLAALDAGQPRFGSTLELSTLALCAAIGLFLAFAGWAAHRAALVGGVR